MNFRKYAQAVTYIENALQSIGLEEDPFGERDFFVADDYHEDNTIRVKMYVDVFSHSAFDALRNTLSQMSDNFVVEIGFIELRVDIRVPPLIVERYTNYSDLDIPNYLRNYGAMLKKRE